MSDKGTQDKDNNDKSESIADYFQALAAMANAANKVFTQEIKSDYDIDSDRDSHLKDNISKRDDDVTLMLNTFVTEHTKKIEEDKALKKKFLKILFWFAFCIGLLIVGSIICVFVTPLEVENLITLLGIIFTFLGSTLFIVKMLLEYLFPLDSDKNIIALISSIINHDLNQYQNLRKLSSKNRNNKNSGQ